MRYLLGSLMIANAALFVFGAVQHAGVAIGRFAEPRIIPAAMVEGVCALALIGGSFTIFRGGKHTWRAGLIGNLIALAGVLIGIGALAVGAGPRTRSNDLYHVMMLVLICGALAVLFIGWRRPIPNRG